MRIALGLLVWVTLAAIGVESAGFWGFLGVAFLYVLYYGLLRPRVTVQVTPQELEAATEQQRANDAARNSIMLGKAAAAAKALSGARPTKSQTATPVPVTDSATKGDASLSWVCQCGARNANRRSRCRTCDGRNPN